jgi:hypothetical protein
MQRRGTTSTLPDASSRHVSPLVELTVGSISVSALHPSRMRSGLLMTSNTTSGEGLDVDFTFDESEFRSEASYAQ